MSFDHFLFEPAFLYILASCSLQSLTCEITIFQVDVREVWEALNSAIKMTESIGLHIHRFIPKVSWMEDIFYFSN